MNFPLFSLQCKYIFTILRLDWLPFHFTLSCIGGGNGNPLQCSCLENPRDGGAWWAAFYGVAQSRTRLKRLSSSSSSSSSSSLYLFLGRLFFCVLGVFGPQVQSWLRPSLQFRARYHHWARKSLSLLWLFSFFLFFGLLDRKMLTLTYLIYNLNMPIKYVFNFHNRLVLYLFFPFSSNTMFLGLCLHCCVNKISFLIFSYYM